MKARPTLKIRLSWIRMAPSHRRSLVKNPNWWVLVALRVKAGVKIEDAISQVESECEARFAALRKANGV
jgi:hypothetical protein